MTRINANIRPADLIDQHLVAEYREIVRIPNAVLRRGYDDKRSYPDKFTLGTGHVIYFYDKIKFLHKRFLDIKIEMDNRNIVNNIDDGSFLEFVGNPLYNDIEPSKLCAGNVEVVRRIIDRISTMKRAPTICGVKINSATYDNNLRQTYNT